MQTQQIKTILYAGIVADAFGVPVEMKQRNTYRVTTMTGNGTWHQPVGTWSDDTSLTLCLAQNLVENGSYSDLMDKFVAYMTHDQWTPAGMTFDVGNACAKAIRNYAINQMAPTLCGDPSEYACGNGAIMRLAPLAIVLSHDMDVESRLKLTENYTCLTHRHPRAISGSVLYLEILHELLNGRTLIDAIVNAKASIEADVKLYPELKPELRAYWRIFAPNFAQLTRDQIKSSGYVVDTLEASLWCALNAESYRETVVLAANLGDDTDTVAAIAGTIKACQSDEIEIPDEWLTQIVNRSFLNEVIEPFAEKFGE